MTYYASPAAATARDNKSMTAEFGNLSYAVVRWETGALATTVTQRLWRIPRGAQIVDIHLNVADGNTAGALDVGYELDGETNSGDYYFDALSVTTVGEFHSLARETTALPRVFDEGGDTYVTASPSTALTDTGDLRFLILYEWTGGK